MTHTVPRVRLTCIGVRSAVNAVYQRVKSMHYRRRPRSYS